MPWRTMSRSRAQPSDNGLLQIELVREIPEAMKPRRISIEGSCPASNVRQISTARRLPDRAGHFHIINPTSAAACPPAEAA